MTAYGYVRKSVVSDPTKLLSPQVQEERVRALASAHGDADLEIVADLDVSGAKVEERHAYMRIVEAIESGEATAVYAYDLSRLHRNTKEALRFFELARDRNVPVRLVNDNVDTATPTGRLILTVLAAMNAWTSQVTSEKIKASLKLKRDRDGYRHGALPYGDRPGEDVGIVLEAFKEAGSYDGGARLLNARPVACRTSKGVWHGSTVRDIVRRVGGEDMRSLPTRRGAPTLNHTFRFGGVLMCSVCSERGTRLTGSTATNGDVRYYCHRAKVVPHGRGWVSESVIARVVASEAERAVLAMRRLTVGSAQDEARASALDSKLERYAEMYGEGNIDRMTFDARKAEVEAERATITTRRVVRRIKVPPDIATGEPARVSEYLRRLFTSVLVDMDTKARPGPQKQPIGVEFIWADPAMRASDKTMAEEATA